MPSPLDIQAALSGKEPRFPRPPPGPLGDLPALVTAEWCPYTVQVTRFWREAARAASVPLRILDAESDEGAGVMDAAHMAGVPCAVAGPGRLLYGYRPMPLDAVQFLTGADVDTT
jgi:hypothetical protein